MACLPVVYIASVNSRFWFVKHCTRGRSRLHKSITPFPNQSN